MILSQFNLFFKSFTLIFTFLTWFFRIIQSFLYDFLHTWFFPHDSFISTQFIFEWFSPVTHLYFHMISYIFSHMTFISIILFFPHDFSCIIYFHMICFFLDVNFSQACCFIFQMCSYGEFFLERDRILLTWVSAHNMVKSAWSHSISHIITHAVYMVIWIHGFICLKPECWKFLSLTVFNLDQLRSVLSPTHPLAIILFFRVVQWQTNT